MQGAPRAGMQETVMRNSSRFGDIGGIDPTKHLLLGYHRPNLLQNVSVMDLLWIFAAVAPLAVASLVAFAAHIDPLSGHWRTWAPKDR